MLASFAVTMFDWKLTGEGKLKEGGIKRVVKRRDEWQVTLGE